MTLAPDEARERAVKADAALARGDRVGPLHGLPVAHKDLVLTKGIRTTFGSKVFAQFVPDEDALLVQRLRAAGAITIGKTNTPEFGAGSQTFNDVFGATRNPYDLTKTCGGSSGGAAVALAAGMTPLADGTDMGGSLAEPGELLQHRRSSALPRPRTGVAPAHVLDTRTVGVGPDGPDGR